jgi:hypothetical protein
VEVDLVDRNAVNGCLHFAEPAEERLGAILPGRAQRRPVDEAGNLGQRPVPGLVVT